MESHGIFIFTFCMNPVGKILYHNYIIIPLHLGVMSKDSQGIVIFTFCTNPVRRILDHDHIMILLICIVDEGQANGSRQPPSTGASTSGLGSTVSVTSSVAPLVTPTTLLTDTSAQVLPPVRLEEKDRRSNAMATLKLLCESPVLLPHMLELLTAK